MAQRTSPAPLPSAAKRRDARSLHPCAQRPYRHRHGAFPARHMRRASRCAGAPSLWQAGLDYDHGTGHGVGSYLGVHEGPHNISKALRNVPLEPGMIVSNEPGYYKTGAYGIRIENLRACHARRRDRWRRAANDELRDPHACADRPASRSNLRCSLKPNAIGSTPIMRALPL